jgi:hypothetical protein
MINGVYNEIIDRLSDELALAKDKIAKLELLVDSVKKFDADLCKEKQAIFTFEKEVDE